MPATKSGPGQLPPQDFAAYGMVVFTARASRFDRPRHEMFCEAYLSALPTAGELDRPKSEQMVTIWPVTEDGIADALNDAPSDATCDAWR